MSANNICIPNISKELKKKVKCNLLVNKISLETKNKITLGVLKFNVNNKTYIHCPIKKICKSGKIKFGVCPNFTSLENTSVNRQKICNHKFRYHFKGDKTSSKLLHLKASKSIEEVLLDNNNNNNNK